MLNKAREIEGQLIDWRREIHAHPELGFEETRTAALVAEDLRSLGYRVRTGVGRTGVVGDLGQGSPTIAIRADMDALPLQEINEVSYASQVPGVMHACGHDAHTAICLGVATLLSRESFPGTVRFLFQPAEETSDDEGISGAPRMVEDGAMEGVDAVLALHVDSNMETGAIAVESGPVSAGVDSLFATIIGTGGHGAYPHEVVDPIYLSAHVILALNGIVSRRLNPFDPAVITIGAIHGGHAENIVPERVEMMATIRYLEPKVRKTIHREIEQALGVARTLGGDYECRIEIGGPPIVNDAAIVDLLRSVSAELLTEADIKPGEEQMGAEDFCAFSDLAPGAMFMLGCRIDDDPRQAHNPRFDIDEQCLPIGAAILAETALRLLREDGA